MTRYKLAYSQYFTGRLIRFLFLVLAIMVWACKNEPDPTTQLVKGAPLVGYSDVPGYALQVYSWDSLVMHSYLGVEDIQTQKPITEKSLFNTGSISKTFVAYAILHLAAQNKLNISDSLIKFFPDIKNQDIGKKVRIYHLLTHSSGLIDSRHPYQDSVFYLTADDEQNWKPILNNDSLHFEPGSSYKYSNPAFNALALIIQQVTGLKWQDYIKIKIFTPAGMTASTITDGPHPDMGVCHAYVFENNKWIERDYMEEPTFNASGNGGVWSSVSELYQYEKAIRNNEFVSAETNLLARSIYPLTNWKGKQQSELGLSWFIDSLQGHEVYAHTGSQGGFTSDFVSIPTAGFFYCILSNTPLDIMGTRKNILDVAVVRGWIKENR